jgi:hypothetical protein
MNIGAGAFGALHLSAALAGTVGNFPLIIAAVAFKKSGIRHHVPPFNRK